LFVLIYPIANMNFSALGNILSCQQWRLLFCTRCGLLHVFCVANKFVDAQPARRMRVKFLIHALLIRNFCSGPSALRKSKPWIEKAIFTFTVKSKGYS
jgi:hypothetical protein